LTLSLVRPITYFNEISRDMLHSNGRPKGATTKLVLRKTCNEKTQLSSNLSTHHTYKTAFTAGARCCEGPSCIEMRFMQMASGAENNKNSKRECGDPIGRPGEETRE
jgi:hypothetical protein